MNRPIPLAAFVAGLLAIAWVATGYLPGNPLALGLLLPIAVAYLVGARELQRFQQDTRSLDDLLAATTAAPADLDAWLAAVPPGLRHAVRLRVEGERTALPGPALTPYLAGLLVLLGMLGTFLGMVVTLKGTGLALENATDVEAIRASLAAPVKGLGLAFGTSVAGVAASAMLGLMSALARRDRRRTAQQLDALAAGALRGFSRARQREEALELQRLQAQALPALVGQLQALASQLTRQGQDLHDRLLASQSGFQAETQRAYAGLAESVDRTLQRSLTDSARLAGAAIEPAVQATMAGLARESAQLRETLAAAVQQQIEGLGARLNHSAATLLDGVAAHNERSTAQAADTWRQALAQQHQGHEALQQHTRDTLAAAVSGLEQQASALLRGMAEAQARSEADADAREQGRLQAYHDALAALAATVQRQARDSAAEQAQHQQQICHTLADTAQRITAQAEAQARATIAEVAGLVQAASEAPRAAAQVIGELRQSLSDSLVRDNTALDERNRLLGTLGSLLEAVNHAGREQRAAIDALVQASAEVMDRAGQRFSHAVEAESRTLQAASAQLTGAAAEVASLGEGFGVGVQLFSRASDQLTAQLQRIEAALGQSMARSDEQLAYYVAQAREIIDLTLGSQKQIVDDLQQLARSAKTAAEAAA